MLRSRAATPYEDELRPKRKAFSRPPSTYRMCGALVRTAWRDGALRTRSLSQADWPLVAGCRLRDRCQGGG